MSTGWPLGALRCRNSQITKRGAGREGGGGEQAGEGGGTQAVGVERAPWAWKVPQAWEASLGPWASLAC